MANTTFGIGGIQGSPNFAQADKFLLSFSRLPQLTIMCQKANIPGVRVGPAVQPTQGVNAPIPGNKFEFSHMFVEFVVDESLYSWTSIFDWLQGIGFPDSSQEYENLPLQQRLQMSNEKPQYSDAILTYYNNIMLPVLEVHYSLMFPVFLSELQFDVKQPATQPLTCVGEFAYTSYRYKRIT